VSTTLFCLPAALITEGILHANNARDIDNDTKSGAITLAATLGIPASFTLFKVLLLLSYAVCGLLAILYGKPMLVIVLFSNFICLDLVRDFKDFRDGRRVPLACMRLLPQKTVRAASPHITRPRILHMCLH
jgi:1,4-dihydroxy-2-naphthoate octaprenyltransferase